MNIQNLFKIAWRALLLNKTRVMLTMLGIIIGGGLSDNNANHWRGLWCEYRIFAHTRMECS